MIRTPGDFTVGMTIETDVVVVGAGAIGIAVALELAGAGVRVDLIESGSSDRINHAAQDLAKFDARQDDYFHADSIETVRRGIGGTTALWGGRCVKFDPIDFEKRPITAHAPWPIGYEDVEPYLQKACDWARCGQAVFNARDIPELADRDLIAGLPDGEVRTTDLERWAVTRFGSEYRKDLKVTPGLTVWTGLTCTEVVTTEAGDGVAHLVVKALDGREGRVVATDYVIATGGLEATRLLLASDRQHRAGLGNAGGHLGRWYMAHVDARVARAQFTAEYITHGYERDRDGVYLRRRFTFDPKFLLDAEMPNAATWLVNPPISDPGHKSGILSGVYLTLISPVGHLLLADAIRRIHTKTEGTPQIAAHLRNVLRDAVPSLRFAIGFIYARFLRRGRKAPGFFVKSPGNQYLLEYHGEHLPHWESRVELTDEHDDLGMRRIRTHLYFSDDDFRSVRRAIAAIDGHLRRHGVGYIEWLTDDVEGSVRAHMKKYAGFHQAGTTRMSESPEDGVVDPNLQVHGVRGLYVASTSVLPTSSQANPTLVGIALGVRLAERLKELRRGRPELVD